MRVELCEKEFMSGEIRPRALKNAARQRHDARGTNGTARQHETIPHLDTNEPKTNIPGLNSRANLELDFAASKNAYLSAAQTAFAPQVIPTTKVSHQHLSPRGSALLGRALVTPFSPLPLLCRPRRGAEVNI